MATLSQRFRRARKSDIETMERLIAAVQARSRDRGFAALKAGFYDARRRAPQIGLMTADGEKTGIRPSRALLRRRGASCVLDAKSAGLKVVIASSALLAPHRGRSSSATSRKTRPRRGRFRRSHRQDAEPAHPAPEAAEWVLYQLDARIDHILVDEAQDTSPAQWEIVDRLTSDFFSGAGRAGRRADAVCGRRRKAVDLRLPGGQAGVAGAFGAFYEEQPCATAGLRLVRTVELDLSFRTLPPILAAVDEVTAALPDLQGGRRSGISHTGARRAGPCRVWAPERAKGRQGKRMGAPKPPAAAAKPAEALAASIAAQIKHWLESGEWACLARKAHRARRHSHSAAQAPADGAALQGRSEARGHTRRRRGPHGAAR